MESAIIAATVVLAGLVSGNLTEIVKRIIKTDKKWVNRLITLVLGIVTTYVAYAIGYIPAFGEPVWLTIFVEGIVVALVSMGFFTDKNLKAFYDFIYSFINGEKWYNK